MSRSRLGPLVARLLRAARARPANTDTASSGGAYGLLRDPCREQSTAPVDVYLDAIAFSQSRRIAWFLHTAWQTDLTYGSSSTRFTAVAEKLHAMAQHGTAFAANEVMLQRWAGFLRRNRIEAVHLGVAVDGLRAFLLEPWRTLASGERFGKE